MKKKAKILIVEDDPGDQKLIKSALQSQKLACDIMTVETGEEALEYLRGCCDGKDVSGLPNLILLDLNMPGMGGKEFLRRIKGDELLRCVPVVIVTTSDTETDVEEGYQLYAAGYVQKLASPAEFHNIIEKLAKYWFSMSSLVNR